MILSTASLITILLICNMSILAVWLFLKNDKRILQISLHALLIGLLFLLLRLLIPFEFSFEYTIIDKYILPNVFIFLYTPIIESDMFNVYVYHIFLLVWICGIALFGFRTMTAYFKFKNLLEKEPSVNDKAVKDLIHSTEYLYGKFTEFRVIRTNLISVPLLFGVFKPTIVLPQIEFADEELGYIIKHEVAHYHHHDLWIKLLTELIVIIYWWNPLVYLLRQQIDKILELRADTTVTKRMCEAEKIRYLECLLMVAKGNTPSRINSFALAFDSRTVSVLSQRFHIVLNHTYKQKSGMQNFIMFITIVLILTIMSFIVIEPYSIAPEDQQKTVEFTAETTYLVVNAKGGFDIYLNNEYLGTVSEIKDSFSDMRRYKNVEEALFYEGQK